MRRAGRVSRCFGRARAHLPCPGGIDCGGAWGPFCARVAALELDTPLLLVALLSTAALVVRSLRGPEKSWDWLLVAGLVFAATLFGWLLMPDWVGRIGFATWALLVLAPTLVSRRLLVATERLAYQHAYRLAWLSRALHPSAMAKKQLDQLDFLRRAQRGDVNGARAILEASLAEAGNGDAADTLLSERILLLRLAGDDAALMALLDELDNRRLARRPWLIVMALRAELDLGRKGRVLARFADLEPALAPAALAQHRAVARLHAFAAAGRVGEVEALFEAQLAGFAPFLKELWRATTRLCAGDRDATRALTVLAACDDHLLSSAAKARLNHAEALLEPLDVDHDHGLARAAARLDEERRYTFGAARPVRPVVTWSLTALIALMFAIETAAGGSTDEAVLERLGGLWVARVVAGEWYRLVGFLFLHYGVAHVVFNSLALLALGPFVERALGKRRFLLVYFSAGLMGGLLAVAQLVVLHHESQPLVGASGCIMGLVGATLAVVWRGARVERSRVARQRLFVLAALVATQSVFDFLMPQVSFFAHATGVVTGFVVTLFLRHRTERGARAA